MAARAGRALNLAHACTWRRVHTALYGCIAIIAVVIGVLGLRGPSAPRQLLESWINVHALFGLLLCGLVLARCRWSVKHSPTMSPADVRQLSRHLSRTVYLLLYVVIGVMELIAILNSVRHGGVVDFNAFDERFRGPDYAGFNLKDDFQLFLASGFITLIFQRVLMFTWWLRSVDRAALSQVATEDSVGCAPEQSREHSDRQPWLRPGNLPPAMTRESTH
jgi:cytochrome b561